MVVDGRGGVSSLEKSLLACAAQVLQILYLDIGGCIVMILFCVCLLFVAAGVPQAC